ncbi:uncharacterized protein LOC122973849 [Thunnus albacares]|uniref:uncharacterized protein LOC122973849 n=1 Tax=Thunnus albacares TaxID=8236 RepID=UPI001CF65D63|nr:uncharacterized protein LOC122973849 [Thunnus albacares]
MRALLAGMLQNGIITESSRPWAAPIVMVRKKDGSWRFCVDYRKLNSVTHKDAFPLPRIEETLTLMTQAEWFSILDLASGHCQVEVDPQDHEKTAYWLKSRKSARLGAVEQRWVAQLASFNFKVKYRAGRENTNADALCQFPAACPTPEQSSASTAGMITAAVEPEEDSLVQDNGWVVEQQADPDIQATKRYMERGSCPYGAEWSTLTAGTIKLLKQYKRLCIHEGILCRRFVDPDTHEQMLQIICPGTKRQEVWRQHHEAAAHAGAGRTLTTLRRRFFWVDMEKEVWGFQSECVVCSLQKDRIEPRAPSRGNSL